MQTKFITTPDKTELFVQDWVLPENIEKRGAVLLIHGLGEHCGRYTHVAEMLNSIGLEVRGFDQRGHGKSGGNRGEIPHKDALLEDARIVFGDFVARNSPKTFLLGHSMGGGIAANLVARKFINPHGLILSSPALTAKLSFSQQMQLTAGNALSPNLAVANNLAIDFISHNAQVVHDYKTDALVHNKITPRLGKFILDAGKESIAAAPDFITPTLLLVAGNDKLVDASGSKQFFVKLPKGLAEMHFYENLYHELFNETANERAKVFADLKTWLLQQLEK